MRRPGSEAGRRELGSRSVEGGCWWGSLVSCVPIANRHARRLAIAAQDVILPHTKTAAGFSSRRAVFGRTLILLLAVTAALLAQNAPAADPATASVEGVVVNAVTGEPVPRVHVTLNRYSGDQPGSYGAMTTAEGKFSVTGLAAGNYSIGANRLGFIFDGRGVGSFVLKAGDHKTDLALQLTPSGSIAGTVVDADGQPVEGCNVMAEPNRGGQSSQSDAQGRFRIGGLAPGKYKIKAQPNEPRTPPEIRTDGTMEAHYSETYYPSALDATGGSTIAVQAGSETSGIEIRLVRTPVVEVSGKITGAPPGAENVGVNAQRWQEARPPWNARFIGWNTGTSVKKDGTFSFWRLAPGQYRIQARWNSPAGASMASAPVDVVVADSDVDGIELRLMAAADLTGQVEYESDDAKPQAPADESRQGRQRPPQLMLQGIDGTMGSMNGQVDSTGAFTFEKVLPGHYRVMWVGGRGYVKSVRLGSSELAGSILDLSNGVAGPLTLVISAQYGSVSGTVDTGDAPATGFRVVLLPDSDESAGFMVTRHVPVRSDGSYSLDALPPGTYKMAAVAESELNDVLQGGEEWEAYAPVTETVTIHAGDKATQDLRVLQKQ